MTSSYPAGYIAVSSSGAQFPSVIQAAPARSTVVNYADQAVIAANAAASYSWSQLSTVGFSQSTNLASVIMDSAPAAVHLVSNDSTQLCNQGWCICGFFYDSLFQISIHLLIRGINEWCIGNSYKHGSPILILLLIYPHQ